MQLTNSHAPKYVNACLPDQQLHEKTASWMLIRNLAYYRGPFQKSIPVFFPGWPMAFTVCAKAGRTMGYKFPSPFCHHSTWLESLMISRISWLLFQWWPIKNAWSVYQVNTSIVKWVSRIRGEMDETVQFN